MDQIVVLHLSDTHFGSILANNQFPWLQGLAAHDILLCQAMPLALDDIRVLLDLHDDHEFHVIVSGDLTRTGDSREFPVAHSFFQSLWYLTRPPSRGVGLRVWNDLLAYVPGNHDHWDGQRLPPRAYTPSIFRRHFYRTPWWRLWKSPAGRLELEIYGIDSCSGLNQSHNPFAYGAFSSAELKNLENLLEASNKRPPAPGVTRIRAILTHHSLAYVGGLLRTQQLADASRDRLLDLAATYRIAAVLTEHTHDFYLDEPFSVSLPGKPDHNVYELRSATTLQGQGRFWTNRERGFLVHRIWLDGDRPAWSVWRYQWDDSFRFVRWHDVACRTFYL